MFFLTLSLMHAPSGPGTGLTVTINTDVSCARFAFVSTAPQVKSPMLRRPPMKRVRLRSLKGVRLRSLKGAREETRQVFVTSIHRRIVSGGHTICFVLFGTRLISSRLCSAGPLTLPLFPREKFKYKTRQRVCQPRV